MSPSSSSAGNELLAVAQHIQEDAAIASGGKDPDGLEDGGLSGAVLSGKQRHAAEGGKFEGADSSEALDGERRKVHSGSHGLLGDQGLELTSLSRRKSSPNATSLRHEPAIALSWEVRSRIATPRRSAHPNRELVAVAAGRLRTMPLRQVALGRAGAKQEEDAVHQASAVFPFRTPALAGTDRAENLIRRLFMSSRPPPVLRSPCEPLSATVPDQPKVSILLGFMTNSHNIQAGLPIAGAEL